MSTAGQMCCLVSDGDRGIEVAKFGGFFARVEIVIWLCGRQPTCGKTEIVGQLRRALIGCSELRARRSVRFAVAAAAGCQALGGGKSRPLGEDRRCSLCSVGHSRCLPSRQSVWCFRTTEQLNNDGAAYMLQPEHFSHTQEGNTHTRARQVVRSESQARLVWLWFVFWLTMMMRTPTTPPPHLEATVLCTTPIPTLILRNTEP